MISQADEKLFEEISLLQPTAACQSIVRELWKDTDIERSLRLMELFNQKKSCCKSDEELFELSVGVYEVHKVDNNILAFHLAKQIIKEI